MSINYEIKEVVERIDGKLDSISERLIRVEDAQAFTNGKVKLNQKLICLISLRDFLKIFLF